MRRRALLASIGVAGAAGCLGGGDDERTATTVASTRNRTRTTGSGTPTPTEQPWTPGEVPPEDAFEERDPETERESESVDVGPFSEVGVHQPVDFPFGFSVSLSGGEGLPEVIVEMTNTGDQRYAIHTSTTGIPFRGDVAENGEGGALAAGVGETVLTNNDGDGLDCKVGTVLSQPAPEKVVLSPGDTIRATKTVATHADSDACWPEETFEFGDAYSVWGDGAAFEFGFGFDLVI